MYLHRELAEDLLRPFPMGHIHLPGMDAFWSHEPGMWLLMPSSIEVQVPVLIINKLPQTKCQTDQYKPYTRGVGA
jgi:hypothetical protein